MDRQIPVAPGANEWVAQLTPTCTEPGTAGQHPTRSAGCWERSDSGPRGQVWMPRTGGSFIQPLESRP